MPPALSPARLAGGVLLMLAAVLGHARAADPEPAPGWKLTLVAQAPRVRHPSVVVAAPDGRIFVAEDPMDIRTPRADVAEGRILCLHPDGRTTVFAEKLHAVFGLQYLEGRLYVLHNPYFSVFEDHHGVGRNRTELIRQTNPNPWALDWNDHVPANFKLAMDGFFYLAVGDKGLRGARGTDGRQVDLPGGGLVRLRPDGTGLEIFSTGVRNILDVALDAEDEIFTFDNTDEHDWMGRVTHMVDGGFYGYPHEFVPRRPHTLWCLADVGAGAACGTLAATGDGLPAEFDGNLFLSDFGKRQILRGRLARRGGSFQVVRPDGTPVPGVAGLGDFQPLFGETPEDFRPVGLALEADGRSLLVGDWQHRDTKDPQAEVGRLWRLTWTGPGRAQPRPDWWMRAALGQPVEVPFPGLLDALHHGSREVRLTAQRLLARGLESQPPRARRGKVVRLAANPREPALARIHALWALGPHAPADLVVRLARDPDHAVARQALRFAGEHRLATAVPALRRIVETTRGDDSTARRFRAATALGRLADPAAIPSLQSALDDPDLFTRFAAFTALNRIGRAHPPAWPRVVEGLASDTPGIREATAFALRETWDPALVRALGALLDRRALSSGARAAALASLANLHHQPPEWDGGWWAYHPALQPPPQRTRAWAGTPGIHRRLQASLDHPDPALRDAALAGLAEFGDPADAALLRRAFASEKSPGRKLRLVETLGRLPDPASAPLLARLLAGEDLPLALAAVQAATRQRLEGVVPDLIQVAVHPQAAMDLRRAALHALGTFKAVPAAAALVQLLDPATATPPELRPAALRALGQLGTPAATAAVRSALQDSDASLRQEAVETAGRLRDPALVPDLLAAWKDPALRPAAIDALATLADPRAIDAWLDGLASTQASRRNRCREAIRRHREALLPALEARATSLPPPVRSELQGVYADLPRARPGPLFAVPTPTLDDYAGHALSRPGDAARGREIFFNPQGAGCVLCHAVGGQGAAVGPDLTLIGGQFSRRELVEHVLHPSRSVREGYQQYVLELRDDETVAGAIRAEGTDTLTLLGAEGKLREIRKADVLRRSATQESLMPEGLHTGLTLGEFSDLISYLESCRLDPRAPGRAPGR